MTLTATRDLLAKLDYIIGRCPDLRFGQMMMTLDVLAVDMYDKGLWDIEDEDLLVVAERFWRDMERSGVDLA